MKIQYKTAAQCRADLKKMPPSTEEVVRSEFDPIDFARRSALEAWDQINDPSYGGSIGKATMSYIVNVRDTLSEENCLGRLDEAILTFCEQIVKGG